MKLTIKLICVALVIAALGFVASSTHAATQATITTDRNKYGEGETMIISGSGFTANAAVNISVLRPDHLTDYLSAVANSIG
ncbi:MAG: hypothetical protein JWO19_1672, partial [Bryobacterales bacterium]|nr:hypothetical protein [Bryobacterales bacterium]